MFSRTNHLLLTQLTFILSLSFLESASCIALDVNTHGSIISATSTIARDLMSYYTGNETNSPLLGLLPKPYYWWESGAMWGTMISYWHYTNDTTYVEQVGQAILSQSGPGKDFLMANQVYDTGNDDQAFWALTAMSAAEYGFPTPSNANASNDSSNAYLDLAVNAFNEFATRWNTTTCNGGLKWQFTPANRGFYYKSSIANGGFFQLAARLARQTGNVTYLEWAAKEWDWMVGTGFINGTSTSYTVFDGAGDDGDSNCTKIGTQQWTYNNAMFLYGAAVLSSLNADISDSDSSSVWLNRTKGLLSRAATQFFSPYPNATNIMYEWQCELSGACNVDEYSFKAYLSRWMTATAVLVPSLKTDILKLLTPTAQAAAAACAGGTSGTQCGTQWYVGGYDGVTGLGQQMSALEAVLGLLI